MALRLAPLLAGSTALMALVSAGCRRPAASPTSPSAEVFRPIRPLLGGTRLVRLEITPTPNPPYMGISAFNLWVADPHKMLDPIPRARVTLRFKPPAGRGLPTPVARISTGRDGRGRAQVNLSTSGHWTLVADVATRKNGSMELSGDVPVRTQPGQRDLAQISAASHTRERKRERSGAISPRGDK